MSRPRVALSHDWLNGMRGGEKCLEALCELYPGSPIYTLFWERSKVSDRIAGHPVHRSWLDRVPGFKTHYRNFLPFFSGAIESFRPPDCDIILSTSHCVAKGLRKPEGAEHICYCFTPVRYAWGFFDEYFGSRGALSQRLIRSSLEKLRRWDLDASRRVDRFVAISEYIRQRIRRCYDRDSEVIYPPADTDFYHTDKGSSREDFYLVVSALVPYKRVDLAVEACRRLSAPLIVIGDGPDRRKLEAAAGSGARFLGWQPDEVLREHYQRARALLFPGEEDFGIVPVEAQACGCPVIAYGRGGALETVAAGKTGVFFESQTVGALLEAMRRAASTAFEPQAARQNAMRFGRERFKSEIAGLVARSLAERKA